MPTQFFSATAEQVVAVTEAVTANGGLTTQPYIEIFADLNSDQAVNALALAVDLGLLEKQGDDFRPATPLCRLLRTPHDSEKAAVVRIMLEAYEPFLVFREELEATGDPGRAANRTKARLDLDAHREDIRSTLVGLALFSGALTAGHGGQYNRDSKSISNLLQEMASGCQEQGACIFTIRETLGEEISNNVSHENVIDPLAAGLRHAASGGGREAVVNAGNAVESFLVEFAARSGVNVANAHGINAKLAQFDQASALPKKLINVGKYLGHVRNAADHGVDGDIGDAWAISSATGPNYVFVALAFIKSVNSKELNRYEI